MRCLAWAQIRDLWRYYYSGTDGVIFVVDSADKERIDSVKETLQYMLNEDELRNSALLVLANKQDLPDVMSVNEVAEKLELKNIRNRAWFLQSSCAVSGDGLFEGLDWLSGAIRRARSTAAH